jgi:hypothetical protein
MPLRRSRKKLTVENDSHFADLKIPHQGLYIDPPEVIRRGIKGIYSAYMGFHRVGGKRQGRVSTMGGFVYRFCNSDSEGNNGSMSLEISTINRKIIIYVYQQCHSQSSAPASAPLPSPPASIIISGTASAGASITGHVYLRDSRGNILGPRSISANGSISFDATRLTPPFCSSGRQKVQPVFPAS